MSLGARTHASARADRTVGAVEPPQRRALDELLHPRRSLLRGPHGGSIVVADPYFGIVGASVSLRPGELDCQILLSEGWCWALAAVLADRNGWSLWGLGTQRVWDHVAAGPRPGVMVDIGGVVDAAEWDERWLLSPGEIVALASDSGTDAAAALAAAWRIAPSVEELVDGQLRAGRL